MVDQSRFGKQLRKLRQEQGISQAQLAGGMISPGYLSRLESGTRPPTPRIVAHLAERLGVHPSAFDTPPAATPVEELVTAITADGGSAAAGELAAGELLDRVMERRADLPVPLRWLALWSRARLGADTAQDEAALVTAEELAHTAEESGIPEIRARSMVLLARLHRRLGNVTAAHDLAAGAYATGIEHGLPGADTLRALMVLISTEAESSRLQDALEHVGDLEALSPGAPRTLRVEALWTAAGVHVRHNNHETAEARLGEAMALSCSRDDLALWIRLRFAAASLYLQMHPRRLTEAQQCLAEVEPVLALVGNARQCLEFRTIRAHAYFQSGQTEAAGALCQAIGAQAGRLELRDRLRFEVLVRLIEIRQGHVDEAIPAVEALARKAQETANMGLAADIWKSLAETLTLVRV